jgi:hypothetical protein
MIWFCEMISVMPAKAGIQGHMTESVGENSWIPGLALLARNDVHFAFAIP